MSCSLAYNTYNALGHKGAPEMFWPQFVSVRIKMLRKMILTHHVTGIKFVKSESLILGSLPEMATTHQENLFSFLSGSLSN